MRSHPVFVLEVYFSEMKKIPKDKLMDMVWDMAKQLTPPDDDGHAAPDSDVIGIVRHTLTVVKVYRQE
jgi:hypothetical protein